MGLTRGAYNFVGARSEDPRHIAVAWHTKQLYLRWLKIDAHVFVCNGGEPAYHITESVYHDALASIVNLKDTLESLRSDANAVFFNAYLPACCVQKQYVLLVDILKEALLADNTIRLDVIKDALLISESADLNAILKLIDVPTLDLLKSKDPEVLMLLGVGPGAKKFALRRIEQYLAQNNLDRVVDLLSLLDAAQVGLMSKSLFLKALELNKPLAMFETLSRRLDPEYLKSEKVLRAILKTDDPQKLECFCSDIGVRVGGASLVELALLGNHLNIFNYLLQRGASVFEPKDLFDDVLNNDRAKAVLKMHLIARLGSGAVRPICDRYIAAREHTKAIKLFLLTAPMQAELETFLTEIIDRLANEPHNADKSKKIWNILDLCLFRVSYAYIASFHEDMRPAELKILIDKTGRNLLIYLPQVKLDQLAEAFGTQDWKRLFAESHVIPWGVNMERVSYVAGKAFEDLKLTEKNTFVAGLARMIHHVANFADLAKLITFVMHSEMHAVKQLKTHRSWYHFGSQGRTASYVSVMSLIQEKVEQLHTANGQAVLSVTDARFVRDALSFKTSRPSALRVDEDHLVAA